ncbi:TonB-dependent receptor [Caulobacter sp. NIBR1757]|uniref:TonB-dependent receptor n=1 Tax=Caulobacter sp. NIBR1757 TaxID=3016000 RepID=UPI0022F01C3C|nr:TonB-dependent receptor [Caulobacter sp. NIBR1757]WGM40694.1 Vitamin B12 transporter BtuB [Caulobacter sp. NIBR1757]
MKGYLLATACAVALGAASPALCQTEATPAPAPAKAESTDVDEVIISATRRDENIQDVPLSVTAYGQEELTAKGIVGFEGLAIETPGVVLNRPTANFNNFTARGVATNGYGANLQGTVAVYIDELPISNVGNSTNIDPALYDVERVEFLRGPQGTLFGSGSLAGALRILTKNPDLNDFDMSALVDIGQTDGDGLRQRYSAMVNVPLVDDKLGLRAVGFYRDEEGWTENLGTGKDNSNSLVDWGGRVNLLWEPTDRLSVKFLASYEKSRPEDSGLINPALGWDKRVSDRPDLFVGKLTNYNATVEYQFDGAKLTSSTTKSLYDQLFFVDLAGTFGGAIAFGLDGVGRQDTFVEEVRLVSDPGGRWDWSIGGFYMDRRLDFDYQYRSTEEFLALRGITGLTDEYYQKQYTHFNGHEKALFGELTYRFTDDWWVTGGMRYGSVDTQGFTEGGYNSNYLVNALFFIPGPLTITPIAKATGKKVEATDPSWKFSMSWRPVPNMTTYFTYSTGFRTPVVNAFAGRPSLVDPTDLIIPPGADSDDLTNYEVGLKGRWFDGKLYANLAVYYIDWQNIQVQANRVSDSVQFATNIGGAVSKGIEWEIMALPVEGLTLGLNGSLNDAKVTDLTAAEAAISGAEPNSRLSFPKFQLSAYINYRWQIADRVEGNVSMVYAHVGSYPGSFPNTPGRPTVPSPVYDRTESWDVVNGAFAVAFDKVTVGAYVENLFDDHSITYVHPEAFVANRYATQRPRTVGVRVSYDF